MLYGNTIHFQYQKHVWGSKPCKWGRDTFSLQVLDVRSMFHIKWAHKVCFSFLIFKYYQPYSSHFTQNKSQLASKGRQQTRGSEGEMMRQPAGAAKYLDGVRPGSTGQLWLVTVPTPRLRGRAALLSPSLLPLLSLASGQHGKIAQACCCLRPQLSALGAQS